MAILKETSLHILEGIVEQNEGRSGYTSGCSMSCMGISCNDCPMQFNKHLTLEMIRDEVTSRKASDGAASGKTADVIVTDGIEGVTKPSHYAFFDGIEAIEIIARSMTVEMFRGYCMGNMLKYRLRAGKKAELAYAEKDLAKANFYSELFEKHKGECYDFRHY